MHSSDVGIITNLCWTFKAFLFPKLIDTLALNTHCCVITESIPVPCSAGVFINPMYKNRPGLGVLMRSLLTLVWHSWLCVRPAGLRRRSIRATAAPPISHTPDNNIGAGERWREIGSRHRVVSATNSTWAVDNIWTTRTVDNIYMDNQDSGQHIYGQHI